MKHNTSFHCTVYICVYVITKCTENMSRESKDLLNVLCWGMAVSIWDENIIGMNDLFKCLWTLHGSSHHSIICGPFQRDHLRHSMQKEGLFMQRSSLHWHIAFALQKAVSNLFGKSLTTPADEGIGNIIYWIAGLFMSFIESHCDLL